MTLSLPDSGLI